MNSERYMQIVTGIMALILAGVLAGLIASLQTERGRVNDLLERVVRLEVQCDG